MASRLNLGQNFIPENANTSTNAAETMSNYASILLKDLNIKNILSTLLHPSPPDDQMDLLIDTLHEGESSVGEPDSNHAIRMILIERLIQLRKERNEFQTNIEQSVNLLLQIIQKSAARRNDSVENDNQQSLAVKQTKELLKNLLATAEKCDKNSGRKRRQSSRSRSRSNSSSSMSSSSSDTYYARRRKRKRKSGRHSSSSESDSSDYVRRKQIRDLEEQRKKGVKSFSKKPKDNRKDISKKPDLGYELMDPYYQQQAYYNLNLPPPIFYPPYLAPLPPPPPVRTVQPVPLFPGINPANLVTCGSEVIGSVGYQKTSAYVAANVFVENLKKMPEKPPVGTKLMDVRSMFLLCAKDEFWSKFLVEQLDLATEENKQIVFDEIFTSDELIRDKRGAYVLIKYLDVGTEEQKEKIFNGLKNKCLDLSKELPGSRLLMKCFDYASQDILLELAEELKKNVPTLARNCNANSVLVKLIDSIGNLTNLQFMIDELSSEIFFVAVHGVGTRLIQKILEKFPQNQIRPLVELLCNRVADLVVDKTGNYVIQLVIEFGSADLKSLAILSVAGNVVNYSCHKFASHVVEKAFKFATAAERGRFIEEILIGYSSNSEQRCPLQSIMTDVHGNYVVASILDVLETVDPMEHSRMMNFIQPHIPFLKQALNGRRLVAKFHKFVAYPTVQYNPPGIQQMWF